MIMYLYEFDLQDKFIFGIFLVNIVKNLVFKKSEKCFLLYNQFGKGFVWSELSKEIVSEREEVCYVMYVVLIFQD